MSGTSGLLPHSQSGTSVRVKSGLQQARFVGLTGQNADGPGFFGAWTSFPRGAPMVHQGFMADFPSGVHFPSIVFHSLCPLPARREERCRRLHARGQAGMYPKPGVWDWRRASSRCHQKTKCGLKWSILPLKPGGRVRQMPCSRSSRGSGSPLAVRVASGRRPKPVHRGASPLLAPAR